MFTAGSPRSNPGSFDFHKKSFFVAHRGAAYMNGYFNAEVALKIGGSGRAAPNLFEYADKILKHVQRVLD